MSKSLKTQEMDRRLFAGRDDHLSPRQKYDIYMENVALTLQRQVVVKKKEVRKAQGEGTALYLRSTPSFLTALISRSPPPPTCNLILRTRRRR